jgi:hypothetical protein
LIRSEELGEPGIHGPANARSDTNNRRG